MIQNPVIVTGEFYSPRPLATGSIRNAEIITAEFKQLSKIRPNLISAEGVKIENIENINLGMCRGQIATTGTDNNVLPRF